MHITDHHLDDLIELVRRRYPDWEDFDDPQFAADELVPKRTAVALATDLLSRTEFDRLLAAGDDAGLLARLEKVAQATNLLWRRVPSQGDTAVFSHPTLEPLPFCTQLRNLLYGDLTTPERLQRWSTWAARRGLPNRWPLPTYYLFLCHPETELFVKPRTATWFLRFIGAREAAVISPPDGATYALLREQAAALRETLAAFGARDMLDVQSFIWVCQRESQSRAGRLDVRAQVDLDVPLTQPLPAAETGDLLSNATSVVRDTPVDYITPEPRPAYPLERLAADTGYAPETLQGWITAVARKRQAIFYGPPGTGKTYLAQALARHLAGGGDGIVELVQFHPAYAYEDFMQGIRPLTQPDGRIAYRMVPGRFLEFCRRAAQRSGPSVFIIDEINRANLAAVFGELMVLLEYRDTAVPLAGGGELRMPDNVLLLGTMNTADRSIALVDHALRRRFAFIRLAPSAAVLRHFHAGTGYDVEPLIALLERVNALIDDPHYAVGHSFFLDAELAETLPAIWQLEIEPYLEELFFDQPGRVEELRWTAVGSLLA